MIRIFYFAWLRTRTGTASEEVALPEGVRDVGALLDWIAGRGGGFAEALADRSVVRVAVNQDYVGLEQAVKDGDEVALFPPVTGG